MTAKQWFICYCITLLGLMSLCIGLTVFVDPYFHYHKPFVDLFYYQFWAERYINDGIIKHFDYDAVITGTSMTQNFKTSEFDEMFGCHSIKVPFVGGTYFEIDRNQKIALRTHDVKYMVRSLDWSRLDQDKDSMHENFEFPYYLYNDSLADDIKYVLNWKTLTQSIAVLTSHGKGHTSFDAYSYWGDNYAFGKQYVFETAGYPRFSAPAGQVSLTKDEKDTIWQNVQQNVVELAKEHPETQFYYFFPPYSIAYYGKLYSEGKLLRFLQMEQLAIELILSCENIHLFSFNTKFDWITNLENYKDEAHYGAWINSDMLRLMKTDEYRITNKNVDSYLRTEHKFYMSYDYSSVFADNP